MNAPEQIHQVFNREYNTFVDKLFIAFPSALRNIQLHKDIFCSSIKVNSKVPVVQFLNRLHPFAKFIFDKNENFLTDRKDLIEGNTLTRVLSEHWNTIPLRSKDSLWLYMQNLLILSYQFVGLDTWNVVLFKKIVEDSGSWIPHNISSGFPDISKKLPAEYLASNNI